MESPLILIVEDDPKDAILIQATLKTAGLTNPVTVLETAEQAIAYLSGADPERNPLALPGVILIDLKLPGKSGHDLLAWMGTQEVLRHVVRVVLTGSDDPSDLKRSYELGANAYLQKPLTLDQLTAPGRNLRSLLAYGFAALA